MQHFKVLFGLLIIGLVLSILVTILLIISFVLNVLYLEPELKAAANFDSWGIIGLLAAIVSAGLAVVCGYGAGALYRFLSCKRNSVVGQMIYILGVAQEVPKPLVFPAMDSPYFFFIYFYDNFYHSRYAGFLTRRIGNRTFFTDPDTGLFFRKQLV
jgi:hypothetical protein